MSGVMAEYSDTPSKEVTAEANEGTPIPNETPKEEVNPVEAKAREGGWVPQDEWEGDPADWVDAKEFNFRGELFEKIKSQSKYTKQQEKELEQLKKAIQALGEMNKQISEKEYERAVKTLKKQKAIALEDEDHEMVVEIDEKMGELKEARKATEEGESELFKETQDPATAPTTPPVIMDWMEDPKNSWYHNDLAMSGAADKFFDKYVNEHANGDIKSFDDWDGAIKYAEQQVRQTFPQNFSNPRRDQAAVASPSGRVSGATKKSKLSVSDLNDEQKAVMKTFVSQGVMTQDEYLEQLEQIGG